MVELVDLKKWKKQKEILLELHREYGINTNSRQWRKEVSLWNKKFLDSKVQYYITHSTKLGFKATTDYQEAKFARDDYMKRAINMFKKAKECDRAFIQLKNYQMDFKEGEIK